MKKIVYFIFAMSFFSVNTWAQAPSFQWAKGIGGVFTDSGYSIAVDGSGNVYTTGLFYGTVDFDPGAGVYNLTSAGGWDVFITKLDASGNFVWAKRMGGVNSDFGYSIVLDGSGNVYTTGLFYETADFDPGAGTYNLTSEGGSDVFITKLDASGNLVWAKRMGEASFDYGYSIDLDGSGNVYTTGFFSGTVDFDPGAGTYNLTSGGGRDVFIVKLDASGNFVWAKGLGGTSNDYGYSIALDGSDNVYTTGYFEGTVDFDPGASIYNLISAGATDVFITKLDASGNFVWAKRMGGTSNDYGSSIALDGNDNVCTIGYFEGTADFDPGASTYNLTSAGGADIFITKLDASGNFVWAKGLGGASSDYGESIALDGGGNVYTTGFFYGTADFYPGAGTYNLTSAGAADIFITKLDASGNFVWAKGLGEASSDYGESIALDGSGNVYTTGYFQGTADFDPGVDTFNLTTFGDYDIFVLKLSDCTIPFQPSAISGNTTICSGSNNTYTVTNEPSASSYTWTLPSGWTGTSTTNSINTTASSTSGSISVTANNACGSSTQQTLAITVNTIPSTPGIISGNTTICSGSNNTYSVTNDPSATSYTWTLPGGWTGTSTTNSINTIASATSGNITVTANNTCGNSSPQTLAITVNTAPATPGIISGTTPICSGSSNTYSVINDPSATSYTWTLPGGWFGTSTTNSINTTASATSGNITVTANNACGSSTAQILAITVNTAPATPGTISGSTSICEGSSNTYSVTNDPTATSYTWTLPSGWSGTSTTNSINTAASSTSGNITVTANNSCGNSSQQTLSITVNALPNVTANATDNVICEGDSVTLTGSGAVSYLWTGSVVDGVAFNPPSTATYTVTGTDANTCTNTATIIVTVNNLPVVNFNYTGPDTVCINYGLQTLSGGTPAGGTYSGSGVSGINFDPNVAGVGNHIITYSLTDANNCTNMDLFTISVIGCAGIEDDLNSSIVVYPNPFTNSITIKGIDTPTEVSLYNALSEIIGIWNIAEDGAVINMEHLRAGVYFLRVGNYTQKVIKH